MKWRGFITDQTFNARVLALTVRCTVTQLKNRVFHAWLYYINERKVRRRSMLVRGYKNIKAFK